MPTATGQSIDLAFARKVLSVEAEAIRNLIPRIGETFESSVDRILACNSHVVLSGMGKAGIIAQKISATFASTGTPSFYLHPAEALHGDLGRVMAEDVVLFLSNSGATEEILRLLPGIQKIGASIISLTCSAESELGQGSDVILETGKIEEACPLGMAPSASSTVMLALGDALALTVQKARGFGLEQYAQFHPAGNLGRNLMKVKDVMRTGERNPTVAVDCPISRVLIQITSGRAGAAAIVDEHGKLVGIFTDGDLRRHLHETGNSLHTPVSKWMTPNPITVQEDVLVTRTVPLLKEKQIDELPVLDAEGYPVGMLDIQDLLAIGLV